MWHQILLGFSNIFIFLHLLSVTLERLFVKQQNEKGTIDTLLYIVIIFTDMNINNRYLSNNRTPLISGQKCT